MSVWEFNHRVKGVVDQRMEQRRLARWLGTLILRPHIKKGTQLRPSDLMELPDDVPIPKMSSDRIKADVEMKKRIFLKHGVN